MAPRKTSYPKIAEFCSRKLSNNDNFVHKAYSMGHDNYLSLDGETLQTSLLISSQSAKSRDIKISIVEKDALVFEKQKIVVNNCEQARKLLKAHENKMLQEYVATDPYINALYADFMCKWSGNQIVQPKTDIALFLKTRAASMKTVTLATTICLRGEKKTAIPEFRRDIAAIIKECGWRVIEDNINVNPSYRVYQISAKGSRMYFWVANIERCEQTNIMKRTIWKATIRFCKDVFSNSNSGVFIDTTVLSSVCKVMHDHLKISVYEKNNKFYIDSRWTELLKLKKGPGAAKKVVVTNCTYVKDTCKCCQKPTMSSLPSWFKRILPKNRTLRSSVNI